MEACPGKNKFKNNVKAQTLKENTRLKTCVKKILRASWNMLGNVFETHFRSDQTDGKLLTIRILFTKLFETGHFPYKIDEFTKLSTTQVCETQLLSWR